MTDQFRPTVETPRSQPSRHLRRWFLAGFFVVFLSLLLLMNNYVYTGNALLKSKLWEYYLIEMERSFTSEGTLGPTTGESVRALWVFLVHLAIAGLGGLLSLGIGALVSRLKSRY